MRNSKATQTVKCYKISPKWEKNESKSEVFIRRNKKCKAILHKKERSETKWKGSTTGAISRRVKHKISVNIVKLFLVFAIWFDFISMSFAPSFSLNADDDAKIERRWHKKKGKIKTLISLSLSISKFSHDEMEKSRAQGFSTAIKRERRGSDQDWKQLIFSLSRCWNYANINKASERKMDGKIDEIGK